MNATQQEPIWLDDGHEISLDELVELSGLSISELHILLEAGVLIPNNQAEAVWRFNSHYLLSIQTLSRLKNDFELEPNALALTLTFLEKIRVLEYQLQGFTAK